MKRARLFSALALSATLALSGCSGIGSDPAVTVAGHEYSVADLQEGLAQLNTVTTGQASPQQAVQELALLPILRDAFSGTPAEVTRPQLSQLLAQAGLSDPSDTALDIAEARQYAATLNDPALSSNPDLAPVIDKLQSITPEDLQALDVEVNPRFGTWDDTSASLVQELPSWINQANAAPQG